MPRSYCFTWKQTTDSSRNLVNVNKAKRDVKLVQSPENKASERAKIMAELDKLGYKLPGVND